MCSEILTRETVVTGSDSFLNGEEPPFLGLVAFVQRRIDVKLTRVDDSALLVLSSSISSGPSGSFVSKTAVLNRDVLLLRSLSRTLVMAVMEIYVMTHV